MAAFRLVPLPVDGNRADVVRATGRAEAENAALVPLPRAEDGTFILADGFAGRVWVDLRLPREGSAGTSPLPIDLLDRRAAGGSTGCRRRFHIAGSTCPPRCRCGWRARWIGRRCCRRGPDVFEDVRPRSLSRDDERHDGAVAALDELQRLAARNGVEVHLPDLTPAVSWPAGEPPIARWAAYDDLVSPWLDAPTGPRAWPLPRPEGLHRYDARSRADYWSLAAAHFGERGWARRAAAWADFDGLDPDLAHGDLTSLPARARLGVEAGLLARAVRSVPGLMVAVALPGDAVRFAGESGGASLVPPGEAARLLVRAGRLHVRLDRPPVAPPA